jgi:hypothetical protein
VLKATLFQKVSSILTGKSEHIDKELSKLWLSIVGVFMLFK